MEEAEFSAFLYVVCIFFRIFHTIENLAQFIVGYAIELSDRSGL